ncbi:hypothetical protein GCM10009720_18580 [Yaniella flava]|uniref:Uncharacterized protein n=2 Tax=Yaniella flava TaxID=287930 RepID=A0ABN2UJM4_9MICC
MFIDKGGGKDNGTAFLAAALGLTGLTAAISASQRWVSFTLVGTNTSCIPLMSGGSMHALLLPFGIVLMIAAAGLLVTSGMWRKIVAGVGALLGAAVGWFAVGVLADPMAATTNASNRIAGHFTGWLEVAATMTTFWPVITLIAGALALVFGLFALVRPVVAPADTD